MKFIIGKKIAMTQVFRADGTVVPVTRIQAGPCVVTQVKTKEKDGVQAVQVGFGTQKLFRVSKPLQGHLKDINPKGDATVTVRYMHDFKTGEGDTLKRGDMFAATVFTPGEKVQVVGTSKGRGFQGVVKRHGFHGHPKTHGHKDQERMPGSIGAGGVQRVFKGMRMGGHMGDVQITVKNLEIVEVNAEQNELLIKGAVPGARGGLLCISTSEGKMEVMDDSVPVQEAEVKAEETKVEESTVANVEETTQEQKAE